MTETTFMGYIFWFGTDGNDSPQTFADPVVAFGFGGNDVIEGSSGNDFLFGGPGDDILKGNGGNDVLYGGPGKDELHGGAGHDWLHLGDGPDGQKAFGGPGDDTIWGSTAKDFIAGKDSFTADEVELDTMDKDTIYTVGGGDEVWAGPGDDRIWVAGSADTVKIVGGAGSDDIHLYGNKGQVYGDIRHRLIKARVIRARTKSTSTAPQIRGKQLAIQSDAGWAMTGFTMEETSKTTFGAAEIATRSMVALMMI